MILLETCGSDVWKSVYRGSRAAFIAGLEAAGPVKRYRPPPRPREGFPRGLKCVPIWLCATCVNADHGLIFKVLVPFSQCKEDKPPGPPQTGLSVRITCIIKSPAIQCDKYTELREGDTRTFLSKLDDHNFVTVRCVSSPSIIVDGDINGRYAETASGGLGKLERGGEQHTQRE